MKKAALFFWGLTALLTACVETPVAMFGSIYGGITDADTGEPVRNASVILSPNNMSAVTGGDGHYEFENLEAGQYKLHVQAQGYESNSRQITVIAGERVIGDIFMEPLGVSTNFTLSETVLDFGDKFTELSFSIYNTGNSGAINWNITDIDAPWLTVSPSSGAIDEGKSCSVKVKANRELVNKEETVLFFVNAAGGSESVMVRISVPSQGGNDGGDGNTGNDGGNGDNDGDTGGGNTGGGDTVVEDYSSATIISCDRRVEAAIVSCYRSGSSVTFTYTLTNNGLGHVSDWRIYHPVTNGLISGGYRTLITDDQGNEYQYPSWSFRGFQNNGYTLSKDFPEGVACKGIITITDVPASVKTISVMLGVYAYPDSQYNLADKRIYFKNVPIY